MELASLAEGYLKAEGYEVNRRPKDLLHGTKQGIAEAKDHVFVWVPDPNDLENFSSLERPYLDRFEEIDKQHHGAPKFMLVPSREGLSQEFTRGAIRWHNVQIRVPVQFFDTNFKWDRSPDASTAASELRKRGERPIRTRIPQPFIIRSEDQSGVDLLDTLLKNVQSDTQGKNIHIIAGPAGIGKTYLSESLFAQLYASFIQDKNSQRLVWRRPLPILPGHLRFANGPNIGSILDAFLNTEFSRPLTRQAFEWMLGNQFGVWIIDGLDEVIARDPKFFEYLEDLQTNPGFEEPPTILICLRDSLMATNTELHEFCEAYDEYIQIYELVKWETRSKKRFADAVLQDRAKEFMSALQSHPPLDELASTPFYCNLLADQLKTGGLEETLSETDLINRALSDIIQRDYDKRIVDRNLMEESDVLEFLDELVYKNLKSGFQGISVDVVRDWSEEWAELFWDSPGTNDERDQFVSQMGQLGLFSQGALGHIQFAQEIFEHFILGLRLIRLFNQDENSCFIRDLRVWQIPTHWVTLRVVADHIKKEEKFPHLLAQIHQAVDPVAFKNVVQLACLSLDDRKSLKSLNFDKRDLSGVVFKDIDLESVSFRECDLSNAEFIHCNLKKVNFTDATIKNTTFDLSDGDSLLNAEVGDLSKFYSMKVERNRQISEHSAARDWFGERTKRHQPMVDPCPATLQLRHLFGKFVHPNGTAKRDQLAERATRRGKQFDDPDKALSAAIKYGYLVRDKSRHTVSRPSGDRYSEFVSYVVRRKLTAGIIDLLDDICSKNGCEHIPRGQ